MFVDPLKLNPFYEIFQKGYFSQKLQNFYGMSHFFTNKLYITNSLLQFIVE